MSSKARPRRLLAALAAGLLFGAGLSLSRIIDPAVVLAFLDFAAVSHSGWNPALAFVMAGAVLVTATGYALISTAEPHSSRPRMRSRTSVLSMPV